MRAKRHRTVVAAAVHTLQRGRSARNSISPELLTNQTGLRANIGRRSNPATRRDSSIRAEKGLTTCVLGIKDLFVQCELVVERSKGPPAVAGFRVSELATMA